MKRATDEQLLWKAMSEKDIEMAKRKKAASRSDDEDSGSDDKPKEGGRLDTNPFNIPRVPGKDDPNTPGADEAPKDPEDENAPPGDDEDSDGDDLLAEDIQEGEEGSEDSEDEGEDEDAEPGDEEDTEEGEEDEEDMPDFGLTPDDAEEGDEEDGDLEEGEEGDDEDLGLDEEGADEAGIQAGGSDVQQLVGELAAAEKDFYANRGMHGRDHHKTEAAMDAFHRIVRKLVRAVHSGDTQGPAGNEIALETQDDDSEMEFPEDSEGSEDSEGEDIDGFEDAEEGDDADGADLEGETQDTEEVDEGEEDQETKPGKKKGKVPPQFAKALTMQLCKRFAPSLYKASGTKRVRTHVDVASDLHREPLHKAGGPFIGPRGGKWADAKHTIAWSPDMARGPAKDDRDDDADRVDPPSKPKHTVSADKLKSPKSEHTSRTRTPEGTYEYRYPHPDHGGDHEISFSVEKAPTKTRPDGYTVRVGTGHTLLHGGVSNGKVTDLDAWSAPGVKAASPAVQAAAKRALLDAHKMFTAEKAVGSSGKKPKAKKDAGSKEAYDTVQRHMGQSFTERYGDPMTHVSPDHWVGAIHHALDTGKPGDAQKMAMALLHEVKFSTRAGSYSQEQRKRFADTVHAAQTHKGSPTDGRVPKKQLHRMFGVQDTKKSAGLVLAHNQLFTHEGATMKKSVGKNPNGYDKGTPDTGEEKDIGYGKMTGPAQGDFIDWGTMGYGKMAEFDPTMTGKAGNSLVTEATGKTASGDPVASGRGTGAGAAGAASAGSASSAAAQASAGTAASSGGGGGGFTPTRGLGGKMCDPKKLKAAKQDVMAKLMGKMKAEGEGPTFKLPNDTKKSFTDASGRTLKKGLYAFSERNAKVPTRLLYPYLCSFIEEAFEHESREKSHANVPAADLYKYWANVVMSELVQYAAINPALRQACEKYNVNEKTVGSILRMKKLIQPKSDATPNSDGNGGLQVSGVTGEAYDPNAAILALSQKNDWIQWDKRAPKDIHPTREPVRKAAQFVDDTANPYAALAKAQDAKHQARWAGAEGSVKIGNHVGCAIHGRDVYKSGHVANPWLRCTCNP